MGHIDTQIPLVSQHTVLSEGEDSALRSASQVYSTLKGHDVICECSSHLPSILECGHSDYLFTPVLTDGQALSSRTGSYFHYTMLLWLSQNGTIYP